MKRFTIKVMSILFITMAIISISLSCFALTPSDLTGSDNVTGTTQITSLGQSLVGILQVVGIVLSVIVLIVLGIKYMLGSAEEKSEYKKSMIPYIVGAALIFAASIFANVIYQFFSGM